MGRCDCGAKHTSFPNHHTDWCNALRGISKDILHNFARIGFKRVDDKTIDVILKETGQKLGILEYAYWRGEFNQGSYRENYNSGDTRSAVLGCIMHLASSIQDDRLEEWRRYNLEARRKHDESMKINPHKENDYWD